MAERDDEHARREEEWTKKREWVADLLKSRSSGSPHTQAIRVGITDLIRMAVADKDIGMLAFLAGWFVLVSEDITIDRFETWMDQGRVLSESDASTDRMTIWLSRFRTIPDAAMEEIRNDPA